MTIDPLDWHLIATQGLTETDLPAPAILRHILAPTTFQGKSDRACTLESRHRQHAFLLTGSRHRLDEVLLTSSTARWLGKGLLRVRHRIDVTNMMSDPLRWHLT